MKENIATSSDFPTTGSAVSRRHRFRLRDRTRAVTRELSGGGFLAVACMVCAAIWAVLWTYVLAFPMAYLDRDYPLSIAKAQLAAQCPAQNIAVFGDSRALAGIIPSAMDIRVSNLASPGASPVENYFLVKRLLRCSTLPKLVVLDQSAALYDGPHAFWNVYAYAGTLGTTELSEVVAAGQRIHDDELYQIPHPTGVPYALLPQLYGMRFPPLYFASILSAYGFARERYNRETLNNIIQDSGHLFFGDAPGNDDAADEATETDWKVTPLSNEYLLRTLALLRKHGVPVVIMTMPVNEATCQKMPPIIQARLTRYLNGIERGDSNVVIALSRISCWPDSDFNDNAHFNKAGATAYSKVFAATMHQALAAVDLKVEKNGK